MLCSRKFPLNFLSLLSFLRQIKKFKFFSLKICKIFMMSSSAFSFNNTTEQLLAKVVSDFQKVHDAQFTSVNYQ